MDNNDDLVNNILKELDTKNNSDSSGSTNAETDLSPEFPDEPAPEIAFPTNEDNRDTIHEDEMNRDPYYRASDEPMIRRAPQAPRKRKKKKKKRSRVPGVLILTTFIFAVSIVLSLIIIAFGKDMLGIGKSDTLHRVTIQNGATTEDVAYMLKNEGIIRSPKAFILFSRLRKSDKPYVTGEHFIRENMAYETIIQKLTTNETETKEAVELTFPEGITLDEIAEMLEKNKVCKASDFIFKFNAGGIGTKFEEKLVGTDTNLKYRRMEGYAFPDTYIFYEGMDTDEICQKIYFNFEKKMNAERYEKMSKRKIDGKEMTLDQLITMASIVQKEAATPETMNVIASVFWNRLNDPEEFAGKLQSDPTTNYSLYIKRNLAVSNKLMVEAYDTYISKGLPPGAICNPGIEAIDAVLDAIPTDYKYFAANVYTGETKYAKTYEDHLSNLSVIHQQEAEYEEQKAAEEASKEAAKQQAEQEAQNVQ